MYVMLDTRFDIVFVVFVVSRYLFNFTKAHRIVVKRVFRYLNAIIGYELIFRDDLKSLFGYTDVDWEDDRIIRRFISDYVFNIGSEVLSWSFKRQQIVALSTCEVEYRAQCEAGKEAIWLRQLIFQLSFQNNSSRFAVVIRCDNQGAVVLVKNSVFHARTKHIEMQHHWQKKQIAEGNIFLKYVSTNQQVVDGFTKTLSRFKFEKFRVVIDLELS